MQIMLLNNKLLLLALSFLLVSCNEKKCVSVIDNQGNPIENVNLTFKSLKTINNNGFLGKFVTTTSPWYEKNISSTNYKGEICFYNHKKKDSEYIYLFNRAWVFSFSKTERVFKSFDTIPEEIILANK